MSINTSLFVTPQFLVFASSTITNTGPSVINGNVGLTPGTSITGFPPGSIYGSLEIDTSVTVDAKVQIDEIYSNLTSTSCGVDLTGQDLGGLTLNPNVYCFSSSAQLTGALTLSNNNKFDDLYIFQIGSSLTTASGSSVIMGNLSCNVYWQVGSSATLGTSTSFIGDIIALISITLNTEAINKGNLYALNGAITFDTNTINSSDCRKTISPSSITPTISPTLLINPSATSSPSVKLSPTAFPFSTKPTSNSASPSRHISPSFKTKKPTFHPFILFIPTTSPLTNSPQGQPTVFPFSSIPTNQLSIRPSLVPTVFTFAPSFNHARRCSCTGDPHCNSFSGIENSWILCNGRKQSANGCVINKAFCKNTIDQNGNPCQFIKSSKYIYKTNVCLATSLPTPYISFFEEISSYHNISVILNLGFLGSINQIVITVDTGSIYINSSSCEAILSKDNYWISGTIPLWTYIQENNNGWVITISLLDISITIDCSVLFIVPHLSISLTTKSLQRGKFGVTKGFCTTGLIDKGYSDQLDKAC
jgi:hypothetical protein